MVGLDKDRADRQLRKYSKGMLQRIGIAQALVNDPEIVFMDEPMSGLDPIGRREVRDLMLSLREQNKTIFFSSHILSDVEALCDRAAILSRGKLIALRHRRRTDRARRVVSRSHRRRSRDRSP